MVITIAGLSAACMQAAGRSTPSPSVQHTAAAGGRWVSGIFTSAFGSRRYQLYIPGRYDPSRQHTLVVLLHGCTQDPHDLARGTRIEEHAERDSFLVLLPEQPETANLKKCWNWFDPAHQGRGNGEPAIIAGMTTDIARDYAVDPARIHLGGISAGGAMASLVAVSYPEIYASIALHSSPAWRAATDLAGALGVMANGTPDSDARGVAAFEAMGARARSIPAFTLHGANDVVVRSANGRHAARQWAVTNARALGLAALTARETSGLTAGYRWTRVCHSDGARACVVEEWTVAELGHAWAGGSTAGTFTDVHGPDATREIVRFFAEHPKPGH